MIFSRILAFSLVLIFRIIFIGLFFLHLHSSSLITIVNPYSSISILCKLLISLGLVQEHAAFSLLFRLLRCPVIYECSLELCSLHLFVPIIFPQEGTEFSITLRCSTYM